MKFFAAAGVAFALFSSALALPTEESFSPVKRQTAVTDELLFSISLPAFTVRRNARNPATLEWGSDGCSSSPDNPFGFPYVPACHRHDFGYRNYKNQGRFTEANRLRIDNNFKSDLYYQCSSQSLASVCRGLADVYYSAVRAFGGGSRAAVASALEIGDINNELVAEYEQKVAIYNALVEEARANGQLPTQ